jgi:hypothetical protein
MDLWKVAHKLPHQQRQLDQWAKGKVHDGMGSRSCHQMTASASEVWEAQARQVSEQRVRIAAEQNWCAWNAASWRSAFCHKSRP